MRTGYMPIGDGNNNDASKKTYNNYTESFIPAFSTYLIHSVETNPNLFTESADNISLQTLLALSEVNVAFSDQLKNHHVWNVVAKKVFADNAVLDDGVVSVLSKKEKVLNSLKLYVLSCNYERYLAGNPHNDIIPDTCYGCAPEIGKPTVGSSALVGTVGGAIATSFVSTAPVFLNAKFFCMAVGGAIGGAVGGSVVGFGIFGAIQLGRCAKASSDNCKATKQNEIIDRTVNTFEHNINGLNKTVHFPLSEQTKNQIDAFHKNNLFTPVLLRMEDEIKYSGFHNNNL